VFAPGFDGDRRGLAEDLVSILMPLLPIAVLASLLAALLQAHKRFFTAEASKMLQRGLLVLVLAFAIPPLGILSAGWTMLAGGAIGLALLSVAAFRTVRADPTSLFRKKPGQSEEHGGSGGGLVAAIVLQVYYAATTLIDFAVASTLAVGSVSALEYGSRLVSLLPGLVTASVFTVIYPELIRTMRGPDRERASVTFGEYQRLAFFVQLPVSIGLMIAAYPIVDVIFGHGAFKQADIAATASATAGFAAAAIFLMPFNLTTGAIYADPRRSPLLDISIIAVAGLLLRAALVLLAAPRFGAPGIAWAAAGATFGVFLIATIIAARRFPRFALAAQLREFARCGICGLAAALAGAGVLIVLPRDVGTLDGLAVIALLGVATLVVYAATGAALHVPELRQAAALIRARLPERLRSRM
jgi:putative peptidoglycan lipid II flippase